MDKIEELRQNHYVVASSIESWGQLGQFGIKIFICGFDDPEIISFLQNENSRLYNEICRIKNKNSPEGKKEYQQTIDELKSLFSDHIYVEVIPNEYSSDYVNSPWLIVTTKIGRIKIGCRKRVISIDWRGTTNLKIANELFPEEDVTKDGWLIHAWSYEKAKEYLEKIIG